MAEGVPQRPNGIQFIRNNYPTLLVGVVILVGLYVISQENYLLFHALVELFSVVIAVTIFVLIWSSRSFLDNAYFRVLGMAFLYVGMLDMLHALAYQGMGIFATTGPGQPNAPNLATQLWLAGRYVQSITMMIAPLFLRPRLRSIRADVILAGYALVTALLFFTIAWGIFPAAYRDSTGLTPFKIASEYVIILFYIVGLLVLLGVRSVRRAFDDDVRSLLAFSIAANIVSEIAFTNYLGVYDVINLLGHFFKIVAVYLIYEAIIVTGLLRPYNLLFRDLAQRESALRATEARERARAAQLEAIMDVVPAIVWIAHDRGARNVTGNRASAELLGLPPNANHSRYAPEVAGRFRFFDQDGRELTPETFPLHVAAATGQSIRGFLETVLSDNGTERHLYGNIIPLLDDAGRPGGAIGAFIDITERVHANQALQESERRYRTLFESMAEGFALFELIYDAQGRAVDYLFHEVNPAFERMIGLSRAQIIGKKRREIARDITPVEVMPGDGSSGKDSVGGVDAWVQYFAQAVESNQPVRVEDYSQLAGKYLEVLVNPIQDNYFAALTMDVTERRQTEARMRRLVESNIIGIIFSRGGGNVTLANDALLEIIGYTRAEFEAGAIDWKNITPVEFRQRDEQAMAEAGQRGACTPYEKEFIRKDGLRVPILIGFSYLAADQAPYVGFILDLNPQKRAEEDVRRYAARLEQSNRELQDFAFVASHDLQEPLRKIQAFGERLSSRAGSSLDGETHDYLDRMLSAAGRMRAMINDLLALSRVTTQGRPFQMVDLNDTAREVLSDLETRIERTGGRVEVGDLPTIEADPLQMHQLLQNLVGNGLKFHKPDEAPLVRLYAECPKEGRQVIMYVEDNGIGFEQEYMERIFQPFQRLHGMNQYEGSGMGLAICRKIVERHSGTITARSAPGEGAKFMIMLPVYQPRHSDDNQ